MKIKTLLLLAVLTTVTGCTTQGTFIIPEGATLYLYERPEPYTPDANGLVVAKPFFWTASAGVPYRLEMNGETLKQGRLRPKFRVVSIFWPPIALLYWPMGLNPDITYDLANDTQR